MEEEEDACVRDQELCEQGGGPGLSLIPYPIPPQSLISHMVSVDVKHHEKGRSLANAWWECGTDKWRLCKAGRFSIRWITADPSHWGKSFTYSTCEAIVWRDPGGSWACLPPAYDYEWNHPATGCDTRGPLRPEQHCEKKEATHTNWKNITQTKTNKNKSYQKKTWVQFGVSKNKQTNKKQNKKHKNKKNKKQTNKQTNKQQNKQTNNKTKQREQTEVPD